VALVGGEQVELIDVHWLFAAHCAPVQAAERPICLLAGSDPFLDTILRPVVESAGYRVVRQGDAGAEAAETIIRLAEDDGPVPAPASAANIVRIRAQPEPLGEGDDSIHRYDREAILKALAGPRRKRGRT
jgi:two-component system chemotaxis sensor kinase CheA